MADCQVRVWRQPNISWGPRYEAYNNQFRATLANCHGLSKPKASLFLGKVSDSYMCSLNSPIYLSNGINFTGEVDLASKGHSGEHLT